MHLSPSHHLTLNTRPTETTSAKKVPVGCFDFEHKVATPPKVWSEKKDEKILYF